MRRSRYLFRLGFLIVPCTMLTACGAPDLNRMKPTVLKPTAAILLIDKPPHWVESDLDSTATSQGIVTDVQSITSADLPTALANVVKQPNVGLVVCVQNGQIPQLEYDVAHQNLGKRFELVGTNGVSDSSVNVHQILPDPNSVDYALGFLSGQLATAVGSQYIGWVTDGTASAAGAQVQAFLEGAYSANAGFTIVPVAATSTDKTTVLQIPRILISPRALSDSELQLFSSAGITILSLANQQSANFAASIGLPDETNLTADLAAFSNNGWQSGVSSVIQSNVVSMNPSMVPGDLMTNVADVLSGLQTSALNVAGGWGKIPEATRQQWTVIPGVTP